MNILRSTKTFFHIFSKSPFAAFELLQIRIERKIGISLFFLSLRRTATYMCELLLTKKVADHLKLYGNYYLEPTLINEHPKVFSIGVGVTMEDVSFDMSILKQHNPDLFLFDPTPKSKRFVDTLNLPANVQFYPIAITNHDGKVDLFSGDIEEDFEKTSTVSIYNKGISTTKSFTVESRRIKTLMNDHHINKLDILKMDIEGAAIQVLEGVLDDNILPTQIACEFERPAKFSEVVQYLKKIISLFSRLRKLGYSIYRTRTLDKGCQIEILAVRENGF